MFSCGGSLQVLSSSHSPKTCIRRIDGVIVSVDGCQLLACPGCPLRFAQRQLGQRDHIREYNGRGSMELCASVCDPWSYHLH